MLWDVGPLVDLTEWERKLLLPQLRGGKLRIPMTEEEGGGWEAVVRGGATLSLPRSGIGVRRPDANPQRPLNQQNWKEIRLDLEGSVVRLDSAPFFRYSPCVVIGQGDSRRDWEAVYDIYSSSST